MLGRPQVAIQRHLGRCTAAQAADGCSSRRSQSGAGLAHSCTWQAERRVGWLLQRCCILVCRAQLRLWLHLLQLLWLVLLLVEGV